MSMTELCFKIILPQMTNTMIELGRLRSTNCRDALQTLQSSTQWDLYTYI